MDLPEGATWSASIDDGEIEFCVLSRGDRVWGRCRHPRDPGGNAVIFLAPDGDAHGEWAESALTGWGGQTTVVTFDLPVSGRRRMEKLSDSQLDLDTPLGSRLQPDLARQLREDLKAVRTLLRLALGVLPGDVALVVAGAGVSLLAAAPEEDWPVLLAVGPALDGTPLPRRARSFPLVPTSHRERWLKEVGAFVVPGG